MINGSRGLAVLLQMGSHLLQELFLVYEENRSAVIEIALEKAVPTIKRTAIGMGHIEFPGRGAREGSDKGTGVKGQHQDLVLYPGSVTLDRHCFRVQSAMILYLVDLAIREGSQNFLSKREFLCPGFNVNVFQQV